MGLGDLMKKCDKGHILIYYSGKKCPMCQCIKATNIIVKEYANVVDMLYSILRKMKLAKTLIR